MPDNRSEKILVAGGGGFLGSGLVRLLLSVPGDREIFVIDNFCTGNRRNLEGISRDGRVHIIEHDVRDEFTGWFAGGSRFDKIYNFASPASPKYYLENPVETTMTNVLGTKNLLDLCLRSGARFFQASTSEVYGNAAVLPQTESYWGNVNPTGVRACYDEGKRCAESLVHDYGRKYGLDVRAARIFNTYGPGMDAGDGRCVSNFINQAIRNDDLTIYGDGSNTRSFTYVNDTVNGIFKLMGNGVVVDSPVNIGNPEEITIMDLARKIIGLTGSRSGIVCLEAMADDPERRKPDITKAGMTLQWKPETGLKEGLLETIGYYRKLLAAEDLRSNTCICPGKPVAGPGIV